MYIYQEENGQIGLIFGIVLHGKELRQILEHDPINFKIGQLKINISFCEPFKPVSFDTEREIYFVSICLGEVSFLKSGHALVAIHVIEGVRFTLMIFFDECKRGLRGRLSKRIALSRYRVLRGSTPE
jgi:hypothetical protein